jgi:ELWxxDGT repeat protein
VIGREHEQFVPELWKSDGSAEGTARIAAVDDQHLSNLTVVDDKLFFTADGNPALWASDGTDVGTVLVKQFEQFGPDFFSWNGSLYFSADAGEGLELWRSDGTVVGTQLVADIFPGPDGSSPAFFTSVGDLMFFAADDGAHGREVWLSDGTSIGTRIYADIFPGLFSSDPSDLTAVDDVLYFAADDGTRGRELWRSDTTSEQPLTGDANGDGKVDFQDFLLLAKNFGESVEGGSRAGDFDGNGVVNFRDFILLANNFGREFPDLAQSLVFHLDFSSFADVSGNDLPLSVGDAVSLAPGDGPLLASGVQLDAARWHDETSPENQILILDNPSLDRVSAGAGSIVAWLNPDDGNAWNSILKTVCPDQAEPCTTFGPDTGIEFHASGPHAGVYGGIQGWRGGFEGSANVFGPLAPAPFGVQPGVTDTPTGEWTHIAITWNDQGERTVYVNGIPGPRRIGGFADGANFGSNVPENWSIGGDGLRVQGGRGNPDQSRRIEGMLADLAILELELDAAQISEIMRIGVAASGRVQS